MVDIVMPLQTVAATQRSMPGTLLEKDPSHITIMTPAESSTNPAPSSAEGTFFSITTATHAVTTGIADLQIGSRSWLVLHSASTKSIVTLLDCVYNLQAIIG